MLRRFSLRMTVVCVVLAAVAQLHAADLDASLETLRGVGNEGAGNREATIAWQEISQADAQQLPKILAALDQANPLAANWIRAAVDTIAERDLKEQGILPKAELESFVMDDSHAPRARRLAFEWLARVDETAPDRIIPKMLNDPSVEFRRDAVVRLLQEADVLLENDQTADGIAVLQKALSGARDLDQVKAITSQLNSLDIQVHLPAHFGFITGWHIIGPFDNTDEEGFDVAYPPEEKIDLTATYEGKSGPVSWQAHASEDDYGVVDFNEAIGKENGVIAYAVAEFYSPAAQPVEIRWGCINANKLWLNGELLASHDVYQAGMEVDQYFIDAELKQGRNVILVKICHNEMEESWAQRWQFQLRVCDSVGTPIAAIEPEE